LTSVEIKFSRTTGYSLVDQKKNEEMFKEFKVEQSDEKLRRCKSTCNKNEQRDAKTNAEL
jgi:hypothetical protein